MAKTSQAADFVSAKDRLEEIVGAVSDEAISLDDALDLFEEAVSLGMQVSDLLEEGVESELDKLEGASSADAAPDAGQGES